MDIIDKILEYRIKDAILLLLTEDGLLGNHSRIEAAKKKLRSENGVIYINVMNPVKPSNNRKIMAKTQTTTLVYEYNPTNRELISKGERRNVIS